MTRLADVTGLDRIGIPVWQAIRPMSKSVSVHQGKGLLAEQARLGACMEAVECAHAEDWEGDVRTARFDDLPAAERAPAADDFARVRGDMHAAPISWTPVERIGGGRLWVPIEAISLDLTRRATGSGERSSSGQGAGFAEDFASVKGLCELVERDAYYSWRSQSLLRRSNDGIAIDSIDLAWFGNLVARLRTLDIWIRLFAVPAVIDLPVVAAQMFDCSASAFNHPLASGLCAHPDPERALQGAVVEAAQSRLAKIAGARDDLVLDEPEMLGHHPGLGLSLPRRTPLLSFVRRFGAHRAAIPAADLDRCVAALSAAGYPIVGRVRLSPPGSAVTSVKMFVPGLGASQRARRTVAA